MAKQSLTISRVKLIAGSRRGTLNKVSQVRGLKKKPNQKNLFVNDTTESLAKEKQEKEKEKDKVSETVKEKEKEQGEKDRESRDKAKGNPYSSKSKSLSPPDLTPKRSRGESDSKPADSKNPESVRSKSHTINGPDDLTIRNPRDKASNSSRSPKHSPRTPTRKQDKKHTITEPVKDSGKPTDVDLAFDKLELSKCSENGRKSSSSTPRKEQTEAEKGDTRTKIAIKARELALEKERSVYNRNLITYSQNFMNKRKNNCQS